MSKGSEVRRQVFKVLDQYKVIIFIAIPVIIGVVVGITLLKTSGADKDKRAWTKLWEVSRGQATGVGLAPEEKEKSTEIAIKDYNDIINDISSANATPWVLFQLGNTHYESADYDGAIKVYNQFLKDSRNHYLSPFVKQSLGYAYEQKDQFEEAIEQFKKIDSETLITQKNLDIGRCYEKLGLTQSAIDAYNKVVESEGDDNNWVRIAQYRIDTLK